MGAAESSVQREQGEEEASAASGAAGELSALQEGGGGGGGGGVLDLDHTKSLQKNGQISSMTSLNGHSEDNTLAEVGQPDGVSVAQKEEAPETMDAIQDEVAPQVNGEKVEKESPDANDISAVEEKAVEEKPDDASEVGFKKIFRFVGFKFTLKKDKNEEKEPVKLLTVKDKEGEDELAKEEDAATAEEKSTAEEKEADTEASTAEADVVKDGDKPETTDAPADGAAAEATDEAVKEDGAEKEGETTPPSQETTMSPFRKLFSGGLFSNLRKKASIKKTKEEEDKEAAVEEETAKTEETAAVGETEEKGEAEQETKEAAPATPEEEKTEAKEEAPATPEEAKSETPPEPEITVETPAATTDETKQEEEKAEPSAEEEKAPAEVTSEAELLSSQEKAKPQGSPLKKLFTGAGLKKLSTKKQKAKKETETKPAETVEQAADQLQSSTDTAEAPKADSGPSSPEESGERAIAVEVESSQEHEGEVVSDGEKKKEGIIAWSSFKKLVTPKKRVKRPSESEDEATGEKAKSATLSSSESAPLADKSVEEEATEEKATEEEPKTENTEKLVSSTEEPKRKMDTSVSWEALMCMGGAKKRTRKTSDSDDEETKIEEELPAAAAPVAPVEGEQEGKPEVAIVTSTESEGEVVPSAEPSSPPERESTWDTLKRMVMPKPKVKVEEKPEETAEQVQSDGEAPKDESSFSFRKLFHGHRKKKAEKQASTELGSGEEDSDTPAVVPLSEYEEQAEAEQEAPAEPAEPTEPAAVQVKVSAEDRSPSWIPAVVEDVDDKHDELSDIPEEAENAATPKSVDTDIVESEEEATPPQGRRLSVAEVKPLADTPSAETTPVPPGPTPDSAEEVKEGIEPQICEIPPVTSVTVEDVQLEVASEKTEYDPPIENAESKTSTILEPHTPDEAMAICTGLGTKEIAKVALEKPAMPSRECMAVVCDPLSTEVLEEMPTVNEEEVTPGEDAVHKAQVESVETTDLEPVVETSPSTEPDIQTATESSEPEVEKVGIVSIEPEVIPPASESENSPKAAEISSITPTSETAVCIQSIEVTEPTVETKEVKMELEQLAATKITEEPAISVVVPSEEVIEQTVEKMEEAKVEDTVVETEDAAAVQTAEAESAVIEQTVEKMEETEEDVQQTSEIEAQSMVIAQAVIQDAMDKVSEDAPEPEKPATPTATIPAPEHGVATTEEEIETTETPVVTDAPVVAICEKPAPKSPQQIHVALEVVDTIPIEVVTETLVAALEEEKKPEEGLEKAVDVNVSDETVVVEEVEEIKAESQTGEEVQEPDVKEEAEEVKPQSEEAKSEEDKEKVPAVHMPVQVVLQTAQVVEESVEEEAVVEFHADGPLDEDAKAECTNELSTLSEETPAEVSAPSQDSEAAASQPETTEKTSTGTCAEVMAQVIEVIEEAVKEIEPVSTEITAAS